MEVRAVTEAVNWLASHNYSRVFILSDSMSMIRKVESGMVRRNWVEVLVQTMIREITFIFVPGHAGVRGNERADDWLAWLQYQRELPWIEMTFFTH